MKTIKILHTEWSGGWGGQEIRTISEMTGLRDRGYWVGLAAAAHTPIYKKAKDLGFPVFALGFKGNLDLKTLWGLVKIIKQNKINIINTHSGKDTWVGGLAAKFSGIKFIRTRHLSYGLKRISFINKLADHIIATGEATRSGMIEKNLVLPDQITTIPSWPEAPIFNPEIYDKAEIRKSLGINPNEIVIGIVCFLRRMKRVDNFLELARVLKIKFNTHQFKFIIVGDGSGLQETKNWIQEKNLNQDVLLMGYQEHPEKYMACFDIGVLSSDTGEATPQVLVQYLMMGLPVMVTEICHIHQFPESPAYQLVPVHDLEAWVLVIEKFLENLDFVQKEAKKLRPYILEHYSSKIMLDQVEKVISNLNIKR